MTDKDKKIMKRLSARQKVLSVFPEAYLTKQKHVFSPVYYGGASSYVQFEVLTAHPDDPPEYKKIDFWPTWSANEAWERAWITSQRLMLEKLAE